MKRRDRILTAIRNEEPDTVPMFDFLFQQEIYKKLIGRKPETYAGRDAVECALALDHDGVWLPFGGFTGLKPKFHSEDVYEDEWGTVYQKNESSWPIDAPIDYPIKSRDDLKDFTAPDPTLPGRDSEIKTAANMNNDDIALLGGVNGPLTTTWLLMGFENIGYALYDDSALVSSVLKISNEYFKEAARRSVEAGCVGMWVSEDLGDSHSGFFSIEHYRRTFLPAFTELVEFINDLGVPALLHSCGQITAYLDDLAQTKIAAIHPLQRTAGMSLKRIKKRYGERFCLIGNIDSSKTLPYGTVSDVAEEVREAIDIASPGGGYILASDHSLHDGIPVENIIEMFEVGRQYNGSRYR